MKLKKATVLVAGLALLTMVVSGCGSAKEAAFTSKDGITVTATDQWKQLESQEELTDLYMDQVDDALAESVDLALKAGDKMYFTIEKIDIAEDMDYLHTMADMLKTELAEYGEEDVVAMLKDNNFTDEEIEILNKLTAEDADFELLYQQFTNVSWFEQLSDMKDYSFTGSEDATVLGQASAISEYSYTNNDSVKLHFYEASIVKDGILYTRNGWCDDDSFSKNKDTLKSMITTAKWAE